MRKYLGNVFALYLDSIGDGDFKVKFQLGELVYEPSNCAEKPVTPISCFIAS